MKKSFKFLFVAAVMAITMVSCDEDPVLPTAGFTFEPAEVTQFDIVSFTNTSVDADSYAWEFGDGGSSEEENPFHTYQSVGTYTVKLVASNADGDTEVEQNIIVSAPVNEYTLDDVSYPIDSEMFWYQSGMGGDPYIRLITSVAGQDNPDLLKLYPNKGLAELPRNYTWDPEKPVGSYDVGYTADYAGMNYEWTAIGKTGSDDLMITEEVPGVYRVTGDMILSIGSYDFSTGEFTETGTANLSLQYIGVITPL